MRNMLVLAAVALAAVMFSSSKASAQFGPSCGYGGSAYRSYYAPTPTLYSQARSSFYGRSASGLSLSIGIGSPYQGRTYGYSSRSYGYGGYRGASPFSGPVLVPHGSHFHLQPGHGHGHSHGRF
ncbi:MAG: hypothetical protein R3C53_01025 [Pirellulaceae bacterium]